MKMMLDENLCDPDAVKAGLKNPEPWKASFEKMSLDGIEELLGLSLDKLKEICLMLKDRGPATLVTGKRLAFNSDYGIWPTMATAMGWVGIQGGGWYPLDSGGPLLNAIEDIEGNELTGLSSKLEGRYSYHVAARREGAVKEPPAKAVVCSGNCLSDFLSPFRGLAGEMDLVTYFGSFPNTTWRLSHMVFPAAVWAETHTLGFSNDRAIQWGEAIVKPPGLCRSGLGFWMGLARRFGWEDYFPWKRENGLADHVAFYEWLLGRSALTAGCDVGRLKGSSGGVELVFWPVQEGRGDKEKIEPNQAPADMESVSQEQREEGYLLYFQSTGLVSRSGDGSGWWPWTGELEKEEAVQIHPETARALGIENGDEVQVFGTGEAMEGLAWISRMVPRWMVWSPRYLRERWVSVHKKGQTKEEALRILREYIK
jgi:anaerobic selenocysteine-containing dehydrogenase